MLLLLVDRQYLAIRTPGAGGGMSLGRVFGEAAGRFHGLQGQVSPRGTVKSWGHH